MVMVTVMVSEHTEVVRCGRKNKTSLGESPKKDERTPEADLCVGPEEEDALMDAQDTGRKIRQRSRSFCQ